MKYVLAGLAVVAAAAALFVRPPGLGPAVVPPVVSMATGAMPSGGAAGSERISDGPVAPASAPASRLALRSPDVTVYVAGEVRRPGVYVLAADRRAVDALDRAGGALPDADLVAVNLAAIVNDGDEIAVPKIGASIGAPHTRRSSSGRSHAGRAHAKRGAHRHASRAPHDAGAEAPAANPIDLNTADERELESIPGIGPALAGRIVAYRNLNGPFHSTDELADVAGITPRVGDALARATVVR